MPMVFWIVGFFNGSPQIGGEVKRARFHPIHLPGGCRFGQWRGGRPDRCASLQVHRYDFLELAGYLWFNNPEALNLGVQPDFNFLVNIIARSAPVAALLGLGYIFWATNGTPQHHRPCHPHPACLLLRPAWPPIGMGEG